MKERRKFLCIAAFLGVGCTPAWGQPSTGQAEQKDILVTGQKTQAWSRWLRADSPHFEIYGLDEKSIRATGIKLEHFHQVLAVLTDTKVKAAAPPLAVYLVRGGDQITRLRRQHFGPGQAPTGYYSAAPTGMLLASDMHWDMQNPRQPSYSDVWLFTEYARHFLLQNARGDDLPAWYVTGFTLNLATMQFKGDQVEYGQGHPDMDRRLEFEQWEPFERIIAGAFNHGQLYSAQSMLLVHYIQARPERKAAFARFVADVRQGTAPVPAFEAAFHTTMGALQSALRTYRGQAGYTRATIAGLVAPDVAVTHLPQSADVLLLDEAAMRIGIPETNRQKALLQRAEKAQRSEDDRFSQRVLARAQVLYDEPSRADAALDHLLAASPQDVDLLYLKGLRYLMDARLHPADAKAPLHDARRWFMSAYQIDPDHYPTLYAWVESLSGDPEFLSDNTLKVLLRAAYIAPQATQIQITAALMMMAKGQFDDAIALLASITVSPRNPASQQVPSLLNQARTHQRATMEKITTSFSYSADWQDLDCC